MSDTDISPLTLKKILAAKEQRAQLQNALRELYKSAVVSITVNMPGPVKYTTETVELLQYAVNELRQKIMTASFELYEERTLHLITGPTALLAVQGPANALKEIGMAVEQSTTYGRLLDIDVFDGEGRQINRESGGTGARQCFVCKRTAIECIRERTHSRQEIQTAVNKLLLDFKAAHTIPWPAPVQRIGEIALEAMLMEAACTPAPGLVDRFNSGAHRDMDFFTFIQSSSAVSSAMYRCALAGWRHEGELPELLPLLRRIGIDAEESMLNATRGVNTQKGLIFLLGIIAAATAAVLHRQSKFTGPETILQAAAEICRGIVDRELGGLQHRKTGRKLTAGERFYLEHGITGIRGEIETGLSIVTKMGLPRLRQALDSGLPLNDALVHALVGLMTEAQDTTILNRHDLATLAEVQATACSIMEDGGMMTRIGRARIHELDELYSKHKNISPGGSADLLAVTYFLHKITVIV